MTLQEIKQAVLDGKVVCWGNDGYKVIKDNLDQWFIQHSGGNCIGLTWRNGTTLNGKENEFYIKEQANG